MLRDALQKSGSCTISYKHMSALRQGQTASKWTNICVNELMPLKAALPTEVMELLNMTL